MDVVGSTELLVHTKLHYVMSQKTVICTGSSTGISCGFKILKQMWEGNRKNKDRLALSVCF